MKRFIALVALLFAIAHAAEESPPRSPEEQFRYDVIQGYRLLWKTQGDEHSERIKETAHGVVAYLKETEPSLFDARAKLVSDEEIDALFTKLLELKTERHLVSFPIWRQYLPLWKAKTLNRAQKVFFFYFAQSLRKEHEEIQRRMSEPERANKAPEPTPTSVTPPAAQESRRP